MLEVQFDETPLFMRLTGDAHPLVVGGSPHHAGSAGHGPLAWGHLAPTVRFIPVWAIR
jgi:hypothetical protein